ncbi:MAG: hypothetical protein WBJ87_08655 [Candidatus Hydrothermia bacterium]
MEKKILTKEDLLKGDSVEIREVDLGDGIVYVKQMTGKERDMFESSVIKARRDSKGNITSYETVLEDFRVKLVVCTLCDKEGNLLFKLEEAPLLNKALSAKKIDKIVEVAQELNAISEKDKEDLIKNSELGRADSFISGSAES